MNNRIIFFLLGLLIASQLTAINNRFIEMNNNNGLSHPNIKSIIQDSYGFIWFGTKNKLNRYDGISVQVFDCYDEVSQKGNNNIGALFEDKKKQLWLGTDKGVYIFNPIIEKFQFFDIPTNNGIIISEWISDIQEDKDGNIWIVAPNQGVFQYNFDSGSLKRYNVVKKLVPSVTNPQSIAIDANGDVWIGTNGSGVYRFDNKENAFIQYSGLKDGGTSILDKDIYALSHYEDKLIIGVHEEQLYCLDKNKDKAEIFSFKEIDFNIIRDIKVYDSNLWVGTQAGLFSINLKESNPKANKAILTDNNIEKIYQDKEGGLWVGTFFSGGFYLSQKNHKFNVYTPSDHGEGRLSKRIREIAEDENGDLWLGTEDGGLLKFDIQRKEFSKVKNSSIGTKTLALMIKDKELWVGIFKGNLDIISPNGQVRSYSPKTIGLNEESIYALCEDRDGDVWLGNGWGVFLKDRNSMQTKRMDAFGFCYTYDIIQDSEGYIWVATMGKGIFQYNKETEELIHYTKEKYNSLSSNSVSNITEDHAGQIWFSTDRGGICVFNKEKKEFKSYSTKEGLPDDIAYKILEDNNHNLWFGTNKGLVKFNPITQTTRIFTKSDGLLTDQFNYKSGIISKSGLFYFGTLNGLISFEVDDFEENNFIPPVYISKLFVNNQEVSTKSENDLYVDKSIAYTDKIKLKHYQNNIRLDFVALSYTSPTANSYAYMMENVDKDWVYTNNNHTASYAKLPPGKYLFKVKASNNDGVWNEDEVTLTIEILPPWWNSIYAQVCYIILFVIIGYVGISTYLKKNMKKHEEQQRLFQVQKEKELYEAKVDFFTTIAHEIRTPVTLINGPLESLKESKIENENVKFNLNIIEKNVKQLLNLINQLLDFRKVDSDKFVLHLKRRDVIQILDNIVSRFENEIYSKKINLLYSKDDSKHIFASVDESALSKIITNLLSNAVKHSDSVIEISISLDGNYVIIQIANDGEPIPEEFRDNIFEPFFQVRTSKETQGSGIGLSIARSLAEMHDGYLFFKYENSMNSFNLHIPLTNNNQMEEVMVIEEQEDFDESNSIDTLDASQQGKSEIDLAKKDSRTILLVEDNKDMLNFIKNNLEKDYNIEYATNGKEALQVLSEKVVDIIISDIMMPEMNGLELTKIIKENDKFKDIIVILLTAKSDLSSKLEGLKSGAEAYIEKPFSMSYLKALIEAQIRNRERDVQLYLERPFLAKRSGLSKADSEFLDKVTEIINEKMSDSNFNVEQLAEDVFLSRSSLHRKIKSITDSTPTDFIRKIRLQKAAQLIQEGEYRVNEICFLIGINSPSYFIKLFQTEYGVTPKEFEINSRNSS